MMKMLNEPSDGVSDIGYSLGLSPDVAPGKVKYLNFLYGIYDATISVRKDSVKGFVKKPCCFCACSGMCFLTCLKDMNVKNIYEMG
jgi:hypothetical protein